MAAPINPHIVCIHPLHTQITKQHRDMSYSLNDLHYDLRIIPAALLASLAKLAVVVMDHWGKMEALNIWLMLATLFYNECRILATELNIEIGWEARSSG